MKIATNIAGGPSGLHLRRPERGIPAESLPAAAALSRGVARGHVHGAFFTTGYLQFVKVFELIGGILVAIPKTRNYGLLVLGPIIINILAFHLFITKGEGLLNPMIIAIVALALFLLWSGRKAFRGLLN